MIYFFEFVQLHFASLFSSHTFLRTFATRDFSTSVAFILRCLMVEV